MAKVGVFKSQRLPSARSAGIPSERKSDEFSRTKPLSGIVGIFHRTGEPVELRQLQALTGCLAFRGPDGNGTFTTDEIGLGHSLLRTSNCTQDDRQPAQMGNLWITADARLDSRSELINELTKTTTGFIGEDVCDAKLILHAYAAWGVGCVDRLRGDFSFGIWDTFTKTLFCARDHWGVKPFYYGDLDRVFLFSNTLNCLRQHPLVGSELNESAVGDFLLFGLNYNKATTTFRDIQRLAPAHCLLVSREKVETRCYWQPPIEGRIRYPRASDYVDRYRELLNYAMADRLPSDKVGIFLSGGLDSGVVAATAKEIATSGEGKPTLHSYTVGYDSLIADDERVYAKKSADFLRIPNQYLALDHGQLFEKWEDAKYCLPEPSDNPLSAMLFEQFEMVAAECRVVLSGEGADNLMYFQMWPYLKELRRTREWGRFLKESAWFLWVRPLPWLGTARRIRSLFSRMSEEVGIPQWIRPEFARRVGLEERWRECNQLAFPADRHAVRPKAHASMLLPQWTTMFEMGDPGVTHTPVEVRYPFVDLRLVEYLLGIPVFPWAYKKNLSRELMAERLPPQVLSRPKTPIYADPVTAKLRMSRIDSPSSCMLETKIGPFIDPEKLSQLCGGIETKQLRPYCLYFWLKGAG